MPKPRHVHETYIRTTPERLWAALTDPADVRHYFYGCGYDEPLAVGDLYRMSGEFGPAIDGTVVALEPPRRLAVTFRMLFDAEAAAEPPSNVTWEITPLGDGICRLSLVHEDFGGLSKTWAITRTGWQVVLDGLKTWIETGSEIGEIPDDRAEQIVAVDLTAEEHRDRGIEINNDTWRLIGIEERTPEEDEAMVRSAFAAAYHWSHAALRTIANDARGEWLLARVHVLVERPELALHYAERCAAACAAGGLVDFDLAYAREALARALAALGRRSEAEVELAAARAVPIADPEDRRILDGDLDVGPWFGLLSDD